MKKKFSTSWKSSKQPRKQRKYRANAPLHLRKKFLSVNLSKALREKEGKRNVVLKKGDTIKVMRGKYKKKQGKVTKIQLVRGKIYVEKIQTKKMDGSSVDVPLRASNLQIVERGSGSIAKKKTAPKKEKAPTEKKKASADVPSEGAPAKDKKSNKTKENKK
jgi:large subunit ribosomal protein L24